MGTRMEPTYVSLTITYLEEYLYKLTEEKHKKTDFIGWWKRYLDNCIPHYPKLQQYCDLTISSFKVDIAIVEFSVISNNHTVK